ncbi:MAG: hypothetical protein CSYNP_03712 [Syntrophus sp. SKADARSKE-3]|nr:hypothetical protein [Syntrophus sp. SKADARSKE-3]
MLTMLLEYRITYWWLVTQPSPMSRIIRIVFFNLDSKCNVAMTIMQPDVD